MVEPGNNFVMECIDSVLARAGVKSIHVLDTLSDFQGTLGCVFVDEEELGGTILGTISGASAVELQSL